MQENKQTIIVTQTHDGIKDVPCIKMFCLTGIAIIALNEYIT